MANKLLKSLTLDNTSYDIPITGVKGQQESSYRTGNVNITADNVYAVPLDKGVFNPGGITMPTPYGRAAMMPGSLSPTNDRYYIDVSSDGKFYIGIQTSGASTITWSEIGTVKGVKGNKETNYRTGQVNLTPANIGAVNLAGDTVTGNLSYKTTADAKLANNGVTGKIYPSSNTIKDKNNLALSATEGTIANNGDISSTFFARNYNTSGAQVANAYIMLTAKKDGTRNAYLNADKPAANTSDTQIASTAFVQDAIDRRFPKSQINIQLGDKSVPNNSNTFYDAWTAPATGSMIFQAYVRFASNATGSRFIALYDNNDFITGMRVPACNGSYTQLIATSGRRISSGHKMRICLWQNSGAALTGHVVSLTGLWMPD